LKLPDAYRLSLACIAGPDAGKIYEIEKPRVTIGRSAADIVLSDGEISRNHVAIEVCDEEVSVVDLGSTNGTYVSERRVERARLENRSEFDLGSTTLMLILTRKDAA